MGTSTGDGTRPSTDGTVDNMGAGSGFNPRGHDMPAPKEKMAEKKSDAASVENDDSAPLGLTENADKVAPEDRPEKPSDRERG
ncbi:hypothetical protein GN316_06990 [Xylophilus sp. Kf1]|nr:hypothetical protein [Xylophilus sp. Kf1]